MNKSGMFYPDSYEHIKDYTEISLTEQIAYSSLSMIVIIFGTVGNIAVIVGSTWFNALKMDKVSLLFVRNMAVADILFVFCRYVPSFTTAVAKQWLFGERGCFLFGYLAPVPACVELMSIVMLSFYRLYVLKKPKSQRSYQMARMCSIVKGAIIFSWLFIPLVWLSTVFIGFPISPGPKGTLCVIAYNFWEDDKAEEIRIITGVFLIAFVILPLAVIFTVNNYIMYSICKSSSRVNSSVPKKILAIVPLVCLAYFMSYSLTVVYTPLLNFRTGPRTNTLRDIYIFVHYMEGLSVVCNPFIYCIRDEFRRFVLRFVKCEFEHLEVAQSSFSTGDSEHRSTKRTIITANVNTCAFSPANP